MKKTLLTTALVASVLTGAGRAEAKFAIEAGPSLGFLISESSDTFIVGGGDLRIKYNDKLLQFGFGVETLFGDGESQLSFALRESFDAIINYTTLYGSVGAKTKITEKFNFTTNFLFGTSFASAKTTTKKDYSTFKEGYYITTQLISPTLGAEISFDYDISTNLNLSFNQKVMMILTNSESKSIIYDKNDNKLSEQTIKSDPNNEFLYSMNIGVRYSF